MTNLETNRLIATLKGWTNINELGGSLIGTPPAHLSDSRGQRLVPDWTGDKAACFDLLYEVQYPYNLNGDVRLKQYMAHIATSWIAEFGEDNK